MQRVEKLKEEGKEVEGKDNFPNFASQPDCNAITIVTINTTIC